MRFAISLLFLFMLAPTSADAKEQTRQLLVTFKNDHAQYQSAGFQPPYRARKRYAVAASVRRDAKAIADEYSLVELEQWPLASLSVYCYVFEIGSDGSDAVLAALSQDDRVESAQWLNTFQTQSVMPAAYNDTYVEMQHSLNTISLAQAHRYSRGEGVRVAVVDSDADHEHEDLDGSIRRTDHLEHANYVRDRRHGTAVASVIGANANNALGIVGVAPDAIIEVAEACWLGGESDDSVCDTFTLAKALDAMFLEPPHVINLSLCGPDDMLLQRILQQLIDKGVVVVAAAANSGGGEMVFPANMPGVISVASIGDRESVVLPGTVYAPGDNILVAVPSNDYEFRSGSSLATAHVSGIVALLIANFPTMPASEIRDHLLQSQVPLEDDQVAVNACRAMELAEPSVNCSQPADPRKLAER
jgi:subtilisin family serine protease